MAGWWGGFPGAGQGGLKEAIKGPSNGISNVSLPLKNGGKKHLLCIFHSPAAHLSFKLSGRAPQFREARIFSGRGVVSQARRVRRTQRRTQRRLARSLAIGGFAHVKTAALRKEARRLHSLEPVRHLFSAKKTQQHINPVGESTSPHRASLPPHPNLQHVHILRRPAVLARRRFTVLTGGCENRAFAQGINTLIALWLASNH